ncbi:MAG: AAA family ATPase [Syntrophaceae bacterium]|nr:AAA family ATPase [Syntrophaceae bacterium]
MDRGKLTEPLPTPTAGATWHRLDLHLHSPGVLPFVPPKGMKREDVRGLADTYVEQLASQGISVGAITDYNGVNIEWFEVTAAKATNRGMTLLPGAEMTFKMGKAALHLLAIFSGDTDLSGLNNFLRSLDKDPANPLLDSRGSHRDIDLKVNLTDALKDLRTRFNCLLIFPHPDQTNGLSKSLTDELAAKLLDEIRPDAIESFPEKERKRLQATGVLPANFWDHLAYVEFSNPKRVEEIGTRSRATYLKLSATHLDALRLAFHDPETRLSVGNIPRAIHPRIRSLTITGSGFLRNLNISWNQDLNVIAGGRGAGKSAILESLRYAFATQPFSDRSYHEELVRHALGRGGRIEVILDRPGQDGKVRQYRIVRVWGEEPRTFQLSPEKPLLVAPSDLLGPGAGPTIFGQREIYAVSESEEYRLAFLDELIGEEARKRADAVSKAMESLNANASAILDLQAKLAKREEYSQRLRAIEQEIETHRKQVAERLKEVADLRSVGEGIRDATNAVRNALAEAGKRRPVLLSSLEKAYQNLLHAKSRHPAVVEESIKVLGVLQESLKVVLDDETTLYEQAVQNLTRVEMRCQEKLRLLEEETKRMEREAKKESAGQDRMLRLTEERDSLSSFMAEFSGIDSRLKTLRQKRQDLLQQIRDCREAQNRLRRERADAIAGSLNGRLQIQVELKGQKGNYKEQLSLLLNGSDLSQEAIDQLVLPEATDGIALAEAARAGSKEVQVRFGLKPEMADHLVRWLTAEESRLFELETLIPQDALRLKLRMDGQYRSLEHLSVSQGAAAILLLLFGLESRILIVDQPDDYLDDRFIREEIVQILREQKGMKDQNPGRQIILATHDATIPVMADAELVMPLEVRDDCAQIIGRASIDDRSIREFIKTAMEGGKEALKQRMEKYGGLPL